jgi:hypothetical protein
VEHLVSHGRKTATRAASQEIERSTMMLSAQVWWEVVRPAGSSPKDRYAGTTLIVDGALHGSVRQQHPAAV